MAIIQESLEAMQKKMVQSVKEFTTLEVSLHGHVCWPICQLFCLIGLVPKITSSNYTDRSRDCR